MQQKGDNDLLYQGKSTGSGLFGDEVSDGHCLAFLEETGHGFSDLSPESRFDPDAAVVNSSVLSSEALQVLDVETFNCHLEFIGTTVNAEISLGAGHLE